MKQLISILVVLLVILGLAVAFVTFFGVPSQVVPDMNDRLSKNGTLLTAEEIEATNKLIERGMELGSEAKYDASADIFEEIARSEDAEDVYTATQIAQARRSTVFRYRVTGDPADSLAAIEDLKKTILDEDMPAKQKARSLNTLATAHCWFARDEGVIEAIYGEEPFSFYWGGDPTQAVRNMLLWSYEDLYPTPKAAASLAYWYVDQVLKNDFVEEEFNNETRDLYILEAKRYIKEADELAIRDEQKWPGYIDSQRYIGYLYRRAFAIGGLAAIGELDEQEYDDAYELFFTESDRQDNHNGSGYRPFAHILQARFSQILGRDESEVQGLLELAVTEIEADPVPQANEVVDYIADKVYDADGRFSWYAIHSLRDASEVYDQFVAEVIADNQ